MFAMRYLLISEPARNKKEIRVNGIYTKNDENIELCRVPTHF